MSTAKNSTKSKSREEIPDSLKNLDNNPDDHGLDNDLSAIPSMTMDDSFISTVSAKRLFVNTDKKTLKKGGKEKEKTHTPSLKVKKVSDDKLVLLMINECVMALFIDICD